MTITASEEKRVKALGFLRNKGTDCFSARVITVNGKITADQSICIAEAAKRYGNGIVTMTTRLTIECQGVPYDKIEDFRRYIAKAGLTTGGTGAKVRPVVSCKGTTCQYGRIDTFDVSEEIHKRFFEGYQDVKLPHKFKIAVGGCPNNCVKPNLNDVGIIGQYTPVLDESLCKGCKKCSIETACPLHIPTVIDGLARINPDRCTSCGRCVGKCPFKAVETGISGYKIYIGGRWGKQIAIGKPLSKKFTERKEALAIIEKAILLFKEQGQPGERFAQTVERLGFENVEKQLLSDDLLDRKDAILNG